MQALPQSEFTATAPILPETIFTDKSKGMPDE
jgi:hypothetical protein